MSRPAAQLQSIIRRRQATISKSYADIDAARKELVDICEHPDPKPYRWEHDNGYGVQRMVDGLRCEYCLAVDHWGSGRWLKARDIA